MPEAYIIDAIPIAVGVDRGLKAVPGTIGINETEFIEMSIHDRGHAVPV